MGWTEVRPYLYREAGIQEYLSTRFRSPPQWRSAGAPEWLAAMEPVSSNRYIPTNLGYRFCPDLLARSGSEDLALELKSAYKGEPLALAEVLHHVWMLAHDPQASRADGGIGPRTPVLVTQYSNWLRATLAQLHEYGMRKDAIKFVEFTTLKNGDETLIWFDEPFADWEASSAPPLPTGLVVRGAEWHRVKGANTWIALKGPLEKRPPLWNVRYLMVTAIPEQEETLSWSGAPGELGRHLLWTHGRGSAVPEDVSF